MAKDEPQSYGSQKEWVTGQTGQKVNQAPAAPVTEATEDQGGKVSDVQLSDNAQPAGNTVTEHEPASRVTDQSSGAKRGGYFRDRDYK